MAHIIIKIKRARKALSSTFGSIRKFLYGNCVCLSKHKRCHRIFAKHFSCLLLLSDKTVAREGDQRNQNELFKAILLPSVFYNDIVHQINDSTVSVAPRGAWPANIVFVCLQFRTRIICSMWSSEFEAISSVDL